MCKYYFYIYFSYIITISLIGHLDQEFFQRIIIFSCFQSKTEEITNKMKEIGKN